MKEARRQADFVEALAEKEGSRVCGKSSCLFLRYNDPKWPRGAFRRNDVLVPLEESSIELWRGVDFDFVNRIVSEVKT